MNVLIINLTRFGDLIQTQPVVSGFKSQGHKVGLVCLENFSSAATLLDGVDIVFPFPGAGLLSKLDSDWRLAVRDSSDFKASVMATFAPDRTVNLTPSISSRLLTYDLAPIDGEVVGFSVDELGFNADTSAWAAFLQMGGSNRGASPFNICDIFRRTAGLGNEGNSLVLAQPGEEAMGRADTLLSESASKGAKGFLALQMGASEERRRWPVEFFVRVAQKAWERDGLVPVLLGTKGEGELGDRFQEQIGAPVVNCMGRTSLTELAAVLCKCTALVTNDTGTMHLAAGMGTPLCSVFLATAQPWDTGPYRAGNICLEPDMECHPCDFGKECPNENACRRAVTPDAMYGALQSLLYDQGEVRFEGTRAWLTRSGADGFMELVSLSGHDDSDRALWIGIQHAHYLNFLDGVPSAGRTGLAERLSPNVAEEISKTLTSAHDMLFLLSQQGMLLLRNPREQAKKKYLASWQRLQNVLGASSYLNILGSLWMFESQKSGNDMVSLLDMTERYRSLVAALQGEFV
ncbi:glycosyltransferase family 9 protein [Pseudodesulfovibrio sp. zrk46]|uniref:glycosyltransferase family 9 protein n=1 Tax=Pseudodesulfovibrio sp. zrk46 TaxID=2725288 RepID=UPI001449424E|nr:glycosyltransferase family 9 protein [Pseudodesulfovibrio sp. zrk46]QJB58077.1 glycosyltransferase family 9 protein [Pseudodesulfovibrio sp. zrk46]